MVDGRRVYWVNATTVDHSCKHASERSLVTWTKSRSRKHIDIVNYVFMNQFTVHRVYCECVYALKFKIKDPFHFLEMSQTENVILVLVFIKLL